MPNQNNTFFIDHLITTLIQAGEYNRNDLVEPAVVLWPDKDRQWQALIPRLQEKLSILVFGPYQPEKGSGPAYWLRCVLAGTLPSETLSSEFTPIIYLPGVSKVDLRAIEECPRELQPLAELQFRGVVWTQRNGRDWTISAFLQSEDGLAIEVGADNASKEALQRSLLKLADESVDGLRKSAPLSAPFFDSLLNPDDVRRMLLWLNDPGVYPSQITPQEWEAFSNLCRQKYDFDPDSDGPITAAEFLGNQEGNWGMVWDRYLETTHLYPSIPERLRSAAPKQPQLMEASGSWPQDNDAQESILREQLAILDQRPPQEARADILALESTHGKRREWVWARLGQAPLAIALKHLVDLAKATEKPLTGGKLENITHDYADWGWQADAAMIDALASISTQPDRKAIQAAIVSIYRPWLDAASNVFQNIVSIKGMKGYSPIPLPKPEAGTCIIFSDALRLDAAKILAYEIERLGFSCPVSTNMAALPSITATSKPAIFFITDQISGKGTNGLDPAHKETTSMLTATIFRKMLTSLGYQVLKEDEYGDPAGIGWTESGAIDAYGHQHGWKVAHHLRAELDNIKNRIISLLDHGWKKILVVTDHGWLLLPGGLPKAELPEILTMVRKGRCARLKEMAQTDYQTVPWFWDPEVQIAVAPGIRSFEAGKEYEHGGLSPQECIIPILAVSISLDKGTVPVTIQDVSWKGLRCTAYVIGGTSDLQVDIRFNVGDTGTSLVAALKSPSDDGYVSILITDEDQLGVPAYLVVLAPDGQLKAQIGVTIGG